MWLLDTNAWIAYLGKKPSPIKSRLAAIDEKQVFLCDIVKGELYYGAYKSARPDENKARLETLFSVIKSFSFDGEAAQHFGEIRAYLALEGKPIGPYDLQIAAIARSREIILVTHNTKEFSRVPELKLEDWEA